MRIQESINELINYGLTHELLTTDTANFAANRVLEVLQVDAYEFKKLTINKNLDEILAPMLTYALKCGLIKNDTTDERDLFDTKMLGLLTPQPQHITTKFQQLQAVNPQSATDYFYKLSKATNYIRTERIKKDQQWQVATAYGTLNLTINLAKPEKDPKTIAQAKLLPSSSYPKCVLCKENVGYAGHLNHPARQNHRIVPVQLGEEQWFMQYSPYVYYPEHCIVLSADHVPMTITRQTFAYLLDFVSQFKHYFAGSNADLPIVGGSILSHDHFQGGNYRFAMNTAQVLQTFTIAGYPEICTQLLNWPLTTLRLSGTNLEQLADLANHILEKWRAYSDPSCEIYALTNAVPHNTITPIARFNAGVYELDLVLRNNQTTAAHPDGVFHPHQQYHHLKKENIGLIEVMGLAILPGRLLFELDALKAALINQDVKLLIDANLAKHQAWFFELQAKSRQLDALAISDLIKQDVGLKFVKILECCGVYKLDEAGRRGINRFMEGL